MSDSDESAQKFFGSDYKSLKEAIDDLKEAIEALPSNLGEAINAPPEALDSGSPGIVDAPIWYVTKWADEDGEFHNFVSDRYVMGDSPPSLEEGEVISGRGCWLGLADRWDNVPPGTQHGELRYSVSPEFANQAQDAVPNSRSRVELLLAGWQKLINAVFLFNQGDYLTEYYEKLGKLQKAHDDLKEKFSKVKKWKSKGGRR